MYVISQAPAAASIAITSSLAASPFLVVAGEPGAGTQVNLNLPGSNRLNGVPFTVRAAGYVSLPAQTATSSATPFTVGLYAANSASFAAASGNLLQSSITAIFTVTSATAKALQWEIEAELIGSNGGVLGGDAQGFNVDPNGVIVSGARAAVGTIVSTNLNMASDLASAPPAQFAVAISTASGVNITGTAFLTSFVLEA